MVFKRHCIQCGVIILIRQWQAGIRFCDECAMQKDLSAFGEKDESK